MVFNMLHTVYVDLFVARNASYENGGHYCYQSQVHRVHKAFSEGRGVIILTLMATAYAWLGMDPA